MTPKVITLVLYNRPHYTRTVLEALKRCDGISEYVLLPRIEPGNEEVIEMVRAIDFAEVRITINPELHGGGRNTFHAWETGFKLADFIVHVEDDTVPAPDCLRFMEQCSAAFKEDPEIFSVASYNRYPCLPEERHAIATRRAYTCWLVGVWKDRWEWARENWSPDRWRYATHLSRQVLKKGLREVYPLLSRSQNVGIENGIHGHSEAWHRVYHHTDHWAGNPPTRPATFHTVHNPLVTAVMITGMHPDRYRTARIAIECFQRQTYVHKELLIINHGPRSLDPKDDARIREVMTRKKPGETLGDLRNLGLQHARGDLVINWDDDDWHGPKRIAAQVAAQQGRSAVLLKNQIRYNLLNQSGFCLQADNGIAGTLLHPWRPELHYESLHRGEDSRFLERFEHVTVVDNDPLLHLRTYDGLNLWDAQHTMQSYAGNRIRNQLDVDASLKPGVREIISHYITPPAFESDRRNGFHSVREEPDPVHSGKL